MKVPYVWEQLCLGIAFSAWIQLRKDSGDILRGVKLVPQQNGTYILGLSRPGAGMGEGRTHARN